MYIALYDENKRHITNIDSITRDLTVRVYELCVLCGRDHAREQQTHRKGLGLQNSMGHRSFARLHPRRLV